MEEEWGSERSRSRLERTREQGQGEEEPDIRTEGQKEIDGNRRKTRIRLA